MIKFKCEPCGAPLVVPDEMAGKRGRCAGCNAVVTTPIPPAITVDDPPAEKIGFEVPKHLGLNNHYLICSSREVVATWENDGKGWMVHVKEGFVKASTNPAELPSMGNYVFAEIQIGVDGNHKRLGGVACYQLPGAYCLSRLSRGDDPILETIEGTAELNERQIALLRQRINAKFLPSIWEGAEDLLPLPEV